MANTVRNDVDQGMAQFRKPVLERSRAAWGLLRGHNGCYQQRLSGSVRWVC